MGWYNYFNKELTGWGYYEKCLPNEKISGNFCLISGIVLSIVGLYYFHMQYLCYEYTPLQFILAVAVCLGGALLTIPLNQKTNKKKKAINAVIMAVVIAFVLVGLMFSINDIIGNVELNMPH